MGNESLRAHVMQPAVVHALHKPLLRAKEVKRFSHFIVHSAYSIHPYLVQLYLVKSDLDI